MKRRKDAREMTAVLDKARELSRNDPSADWSEAEWKVLMAAAVSQELERKPAGRGTIWKPVFAYGTLSLIIVAIIGLALKNRVFRPAVIPVPQASVLAQKPVSPPLPAIEAPPAEMPAVIAQTPRPPRAPNAADATKLAHLKIRPQEPAAPREEGSQDVLSVKLISPDTGLRIVWFLNKNFEWKGESQ